MAEEVGILGQGDAAEEILRGSYRVADLAFPEVQQFIDGLKTQPAVLEGESIFKGFILAEFRFYSKKMREPTGSSPSGRHVGHYKVAHRDINWFHTTMAQLPV
ncbi:MAG: hypothetical protein ACREBR_00675 [bacterium]